MRILVTGATGNVGREVVEALRDGDAGAEVRAVTRDASSAALPAHVELVEADLTNEADVARTLEGVDRVFLNMPDDDGKAFFAALSGSDVGYIVLLSSFTAAVPLPSGEDNVVRIRHLGGERALAESGRPFAALRPAGFDANILMWLSAAEHDVVRAPTVDARLPKVDPRDIAASAAALLSGAAARQGTFSITGPERISTRQEVAIVAEVTGRPLELREIDAEEAAALAFPGGTPELVARSVLETLGEGAAALDPSGDVERLTGRAPRTFRQWAADHREMLTAAGA